MRFPKKADGVAGREADRACGVDLGLEVALGSPGGLKAFAAGLGRNSMARTLNLADADDADVGVLTGPPGV